MNEFQKDILQEISNFLPDHKEYDPKVSHAPKRKDVLTKEEKKLALKNALRYFNPELHPKLADEFAQELKKLRSNLHVPLQAEL